MRVGLRRCIRGLLRVMLLSRGMIVCSSSILDIPT